MVSCELTSMKYDVDEAARRLIAAFVGPDPLPAGGAAGVLAVAMGAALGTKVLRLSGASDAPARLERLLKRLLPQFRGDCEAFEAVLGAFRFSREDPMRECAVQDAWNRATAASVDLARISRDVEMLLAAHAGRVKRSMVGDIDASLRLVRTGRAIAVSNAKENARHLDPLEARELLERLDVGGDPGTPEG